jgi:hypothetical protein
LIKMNILYSDYFINSLSFVGLTMILLYHIKMDCVRTVLKRRRAFGILTKV